MKKKTLILLMSILLTATLSACGGKPVSPEVPADTDTLPASAEQAGQPPQGEQQGPPPNAPQGNYEPPQLAVSSEVIDGIISSFSAREYAAGGVSDDELAAILQSGQKAPSAMNQQPWHFTVVRNRELAESLTARNYKEDNVAIVISGFPNEKVGVNIAFDTGLATQNMYMAAQSLGLGAHLYYGGVDNINENMKEILGIPEGYEAQIIMLIGPLDESVDTVASATPRNQPSVNYID